MSPRRISARRVFRYPRNARSIQKGMTLLNVPHYNYIEHCIYALEVFHLKRSFVLFPEKKVYSKVYASMLTAW